MMNKVTKYGLMTIAAVLLAAMAFAGAASAENVAPESFTGTILVNGSVNGGWPTLDQSVSVTDGYYIKNESNWRAVVESVNTGETTYNPANLVLTNDIVFTAEVPSLGKSSAKKFQGHIYGNGYKIVNFTQSGAEAHGLICYAGDGCALNYVQMWDCNIASTASDVGGFIGFPDCGSGGGDMSIWGSSLKFSNVTTTSTNLGGFTGYVKNTNLLINASCIDRVYLSSSSGITAGFCVQATSSVNITDSWINGSQLINGRGGLIGTIYANSIMSNVTVKECNISGDKNTAGLIGQLQATVTFDGCKVENCSIGCTNSVRNMGALAGFGNVIFNGSQTWARYCWINIDTNNAVGSLLGGQGSVIIQDVAPQHYMVNSPNYPNYRDISGIDNSFNGSSSEGVGSQIGKTLFAGKDYGYGSVKDVTYDANGATSGSVPAKQTYEPGSTVTVAGQGDLAKFGYDFNGWNVGSSSGALVLPGETFTISADSTLYANWSAIEYTITYNNMTGATNPEANPETYNVTSQLPITLENANKPGYTFENWYNSSVFTDASRNNTIPAGSTGDKVFYANWTAVEYNKSIIGGVATFGDGLPVAEVVVGSANPNITNVSFKFMGSPADIATKPSGYKSIATINDAFNLSITGTQDADVTVVFNATGSDTIFLAHNKSGNWEFLKATSTGVPNEYKAVVTKASGFSPFQVISAVANDPVYTPSSSKQTGSTVILQEGQVAPTAYATAAPTVAPTAKPTEQPASPTVIATEKPTTQATTSKSPAPVVGLLAGLGAAAVLLRMRK